MATTRRRVLIGSVLLVLAPAAGGAQTAPIADYTLSSGDRLRIVVFGEEELGGEFELDGAGMFSMPLIGTVSAKGLTIRALEQRITETLRGGYLREPRVSVEVLNYRPFYIFGEVNSPGSFPYRAGMTLLNAVALAGGFTYRANERRVEISRGDGETITATPQTEVLPGDIIRVKERFF